MPSGPDRLWRAAAVAALLTCGSASAQAADLTYLAHAPNARSAHPPLIVLLHGSDADERDMIGLWTQLPDTFLVVAPRGPFADGNGGYRWYRRPLAGRAGDVATSRKVLDTTIDDIVRRFDADPTRVFIGGFSQGAVMAYDMALREPGRFRGAAILSGSLFPGDGAHLPAGADPARLAIFIGHGTADTRIPLAAANAAHDALGRLRVPVTFHAYPGMGHGTEDAEINDLGRWLIANGGADAAAHP